MNIKDYDLVLTPFAYKAGKVALLKPIGKDASFTRTSNSYRIGEGGTYEPILSDTVRLSKPFTTTSTTDSNYEFGINRLTNSQELGSTDYEKGGCELVYDNTKHFTTNGDKVYRVDTNNDVPYIRYDDYLPDGVFSVALAEGKLQFTQVTVVTIEGNLSILIDLQTGAIVDTEGELTYYNITQGQNNSYRVSIAFTNCVAFEVYPNESGTLNDRNTTTTMVEAIYISSPQVNDGEYEIGYAGTYDNALIQTESKTITSTVEDCSCFLFEGNITYAVNNDTVDISNVYGVTSTTYSNDSPNESTPSEQLEFENNSINQFRGYYVPFSNDAFKTTEIHTILKPTDHNKVFFVFGDTPITDSTVKFNTGYDKLSMVEWEVSEQRLYTTYPHIDGTIYPLSNGWYYVTLSVFHIDPTQSNNGVSVLFGYDKSGLDYGNGATALHHKTAIVTENNTPFALLSEGNKVSDNLTLDNLINSNALSTTEGTITIDFKDMGTSSNADSAIRFNDSNGNEVFEMNFDNAGVRFNTESFQVAYIGYEKNTVFDIKYKGKEVTILQDNTVIGTRTRNTELSIDEIVINPTRSKFLINKILLSKRKL